MKTTDMEGFFFMQISIACDVHKNVKSHVGGAFHRGNSMFGVKTAQRQLHILRELEKRNKKCFHRRRLIGTALCSNLQLLTQLLVLTLIFGVAFFREKFYERQTETKN